MTHHHSESDHAHHCGCSHSGGGCCGSNGGGCCQSSAPTFNQRERDFLLNLLERQFLPVAQFVVKSSQTHEFEMVALSPVFLESPTDSIEQIRATGEMLYKLEELGLLTLDFDIPLDPLSYEMYTQSTAFAYLQETVELGKTMGGHLGDIATIEQGTIAITAKCIQQYSA